MSEQDEGPVTAIVATVSTVAATIYGILTGVLSGALSMAEGILTLDPSFILSGDWFVVGRLVAGFVGPAFLPGVPWSAVLGLLGLGSIALLLYKRSRKRKQSS